MKEFSSLFINGNLIVIAKPNKKKNCIVEYNKEQKTLTVEIHAPAEDNKANNELVKFLSKELGKKLRIKSGFTSKKKILVFDSP